jgi:hypothetical protein
LERCERLTIGRRATNGLITRFTTNGVSGTTGLDAVSIAFTAPAVSADFLLTATFRAGFGFDLDVKFFTTLGLTAAFVLTFDFTAITHILFWILETPSASF